ncbi:RNA-binding S4 domain-containing protein [Actinomyces sp. ZJ308]|uniref:RNA-binding S4 domain-containing protein n=1 Tax=Actinomyces sp. ZJ308 TaxID=2708342 RepID=UPI00141F1B6C|nr:RNA-binding S4 domain-containing protein [Actinomyces sp. ZJ308]
MTHATSQNASRYPTVSVSGSIKLGQFLKLAGLVEDGAQARIAIQSGDVTVNGALETRRGHHLSDGDVVVIDHPAGRVGAIVEQPGSGTGPGPRR